MLQVRAFLKNNRILKVPQGRATELIRYHCHPTASLSCLQVIDDPRGILIDAPSRAWFSGYGSVVCRFFGNLTREPKRCARSRWSRSPAIMLKAIKRTRRTRRRTTTRGVCVAMALKLPTPTHIKRSAECTRVVCR